MIPEIYNELCNIAGSDAVLTDEPMKKHTTFRIGGPADYFVSPSTVESLSETVRFCIRENIPYTILGNGSNLLVSDEGYRGIVIQILKQMGEIKVDSNIIDVQAGALLVKTAHAAADNNLTGMEFASGIPGTIGGALVMNAGAYGGEMKQILEKALVMTPEGELLWLTADELELGYRTSIISRKNYIALRAILRLQPGDPSAIKARMDELKEARTTKQPLEYPSAGSTFKRPEGYFAGKLIQDAGLKGYKVGGAQVSQKHSGFVINTGNATAADVLNLIHDVQRSVFDQFGVRLETEVRMLGF